MNRKKYVFISLLVSSILLITSCANEESKQEAEKLLQKQSEALDEQQEEVEELYSKVDRVRDSLEKLEDELVGEKVVLEASRDSLEQQLKAEKEAELSERKEEISSRLNLLEDSISDLQNRINDLGIQKDTLAIQEKEVAEQKEIAREKLVTGIDEIDNRLDEIESQALVKQKEIDLNQQRITLAERKIDLLEDEKRLYQRERNDLVKEGADETEIENFDLKISEIEGYLDAEYEKIRSAQKAINTHTEWLVSVAALREKLEGMMDEEYDRKATIDAFTQEQIVRLENEMKSLNSEINMLDSTRGMLVDQKQKFDSILTNLDKQIELVKSEELSELLAEQAILEKEEAELEAESREIQEMKDQYPVTSVGVDVPGSKLLSELEKEIETRRNEMQELRNEISMEKQQLAERRAEIEQKRSKTVAVAATSVGVIVGLVVLAVLILYFIGRRSLRKKSDKKS